MLLTAMTDVLIIVLYMLTKTSVFTLDLTWREKNLFELFSCVCLGFHAIFSTSTSFFVLPGYN